MSGIVGTNLLAQVGFIVKDIETTKRKWAAFLGMEVPHAHIHLVPLQTEGDMDFRKEKKQLPPERFAAIAAAISEAFNQ